MKSMKNIITQVSNLPLFEKIDYIQNINLFKEKLPKTIKRHIIHMYQKKHKLFIVVSHPAIRVELNHKKQDIMFMLKLLQEHNKILTDVQELVIFNTNKPKVINNNNTIIRMKKHFDEQSKATFINQLDDIVLYNKLEAIREAIIEGIVLTNK